MTTLEQTMETIKTMPPTDRRQLHAWLREQERLDAAPPVVVSRAAETVEEQLARFRKAQQWIKEHRTEYVGQWVALEGDRLVSHGPDALQVDAAARAAGIKAPFLERIEAEPEGPYWGGWL